MTMDLSFKGLQDSEWQALETMFPLVPKRGRGKPHTPWRKVVNTLLFMHVSKEKWAAVPKGAECASKSAAHRWLKIWEQNGFWTQLLAALPLKKEGR